MNPVERLARHVIETRYEDLPESAVRGAKTFILDSVGVGVAGSNGPWVKELLATVARWGSGNESRSVEPC